MAQTLSQALPSDPAPPKVLRSPIKSLSQHFALCALLTSLGLCACGAKTGLRQPDATIDTPDDVFVRFDSCVAGSFDLVRRSAEMLFVIDRSGSMSAALSAGEPTTRWQAMRSVFQRTLPLFDRDVEMGVMFYPRVPLDTRAGSLQYCELSPVIDVSPGAQSAEEIIRAIFADNPRGATPTAAVISRATSYLQSREARGRNRYILLATDGAPNCNPSLDLTTCTCLGAAGSCAGSSEFCLDDQASVSAVNSARIAGITVYVVGIDGDLDPLFRAVLDRMAVAGGRALPAGTPGSSSRYYSIGDYSQLLSAFTGIQRTVAQCSFVTPSRPDDPDAIDVLITGAPVARDTLHRQGWDWTDRDYGELSLYGSPCETVIALRPRLQATVRCARP